MRQPTVIRNFLDEEQRPAGGTVESQGVMIDWQDGPVQDGEPNGAFVEDIIEIAQRRLEFYQSGKYACTENATAIGALEHARHALAERIEKRQAAGTFNTYEV